MIEKNALESLVSKTLDYQKERVMSHAIRKLGMYSDYNTFPLASLQLELTRICNANCKHCYNYSGRQLNERQLSPEEWMTFANYLVDNGGVFECILSGGEPLLLGDDLIRLMDILHNGGSCFMLLTNGYLLNADVVGKLKKYRYHWLQISIDGANANYHDAFRQKKGSWKRAVAAAKSVSEAGIPLKIAHCITPENLKDVEKMCHLAYQLGASEIVLGEICYSGRSTENKTLFLNVEQRKTLSEIVEAMNNMFEGRMIVKGSNKLQEGLIKHSKKPKSSAVIRPNGDIRIDAMAPFVIGNILEDDFADVWDHKIVKAWNDDRVIEYIRGFSKEDRNTEHINYIDADIRL